MIPYSTEDYKKYIYAHVAHRIGRIGDTVNRLELDADTEEELVCSLIQVQWFLYHAAFVDDEDAAKEVVAAYVDDDDAAEEVGCALDLMRRSDLNTYSDGRPVTTTIRWDGGYVTHVWHPDPMHPDNRPGQVRNLQEESWPCRRKLVITAPGIIDTFETDEEVDE
jgi:hypothetical protein